mmetsp:Transcript_79099/g.219813  ORF Transcript_79099/g.219813 Transcript_79099/m.219813 type:complete len:233 (+) Transcript_79099:554-1252(+)
MSQGDSPAMCSTAVEKSSKRYTCGGWYSLPSAKRKPSPRCTTSRSCAKPENTPSGEYNICTSPRRHGYSGPRKSSSDRKENGSLKSDTKRGSRKDPLSAVSGTMGTVRNTSTGSIAERFKPGDVSVGAVIMRLSLYKMLPYDAGCAATRMAKATMTTIVITSAFEKSVGSLSHLSKTSGEYEGASLHVVRDKKLLVRVVERRRGRIGKSSSLQERPPWWRRRCPAGSAARIP